MSAACASSSTENTSAGATTPTPFVFLAFSSRHHVLGAHQRKRNHGLADHFAHEPAANARTSSPSAATACTLNQIQIRRSGDPHGRRHALALGTNQHISLDGAKGATLVKGAIILRVSRACDTHFVAVPAATTAMSMSRFCHDVTERNKKNTKKRRPEK